MKKDQNDIHIHLPFFYRAGRFTRILAVVILVLAAASVLVWWVLLGSADERAHRIRMVAAGVNLTLVLLLVFRICWYGYDDHYFQNFTMICAASSILYVAGMFIGRVDILPAPEEGATLSYYFAEFLIYAGLAGIMSILPSAVTGLVLWCIVRLFGDPG
ncbi:MAG: hypothetical protein LUF27_11810 [Lachnospiraceae bacterium]|nr:hypothetical protein [Lachnospiraceae bacterium]